MKSKYFKFLIIALAVAVIVPQVALASWWNPMSWGWLNRIFHFQQTEQKQEQIIKQDAKKETPADQTASWKTYTNTKYGFEFKYPSTWIVDENETKSHVNIWSSEKEKQDAINAIIPIYSEFTVNYQDTISFNGFAKGLLGRDVSGVKDFVSSYEGFGSYAEINIAGQKAYAVISVANRAVYTVYIELNGEVYVLSTEDLSKGGSNPKNPRLDINIKNIISTFKFTNNQSVVGGDKDAHGCIGSAGYTWCEAKQKCLRSWEEPCSVIKTEILINAPVLLSNIDLVNKHIDAKTRSDNKAIRIVVSGSTKFTSTCRPQMSNLGGFYDLNKGWDGPGWFFHVNGVLSDDGTIIFADEISCIAQ